MSIDLNELEELHDLSNHESTEENLVNSLREFTAEDSGHHTEEEISFRPFQEQQEASSMTVEDDISYKPVSGSTVDGGGVTDEGSSVNSSTEEEAASGSLGQMITPEMTIEVFDLLFSRLGVFGISKFTDLEVEVKDLKLTAEEKRSLKRPVKQVLDGISFSMSPMNQLLLTVTIIYGSKLYALKPDVRENLEKAKPKKSSRGASKGYVKQWIDKKNKVLNPEHSKYNEFVSQGLGT